MAGTSKKKDLTRREVFRLVAGTAGALAFGNVFASSAEAAPAPLSSIVMEAETGRILQARAPDYRHRPASLNKILTLMLAFDAIDAGFISPDEVIEVTPDITKILYANDEWRERRHLKNKNIPLRAHIDAMIVGSLNESAIVVARRLAGSEESFAALMEQKAHAIGATNTTIRNATGYTHAEQWTTARDQALIAQHLVYAYAAYYPLFSQKKVDVATQDSNSLQSHNHLFKLLGSADGIKTGWTQASRANLMASAAQDGKRVVAVVCRAPAPLVAAQAVNDMIRNAGFPRHSKNFRDLDPPVTDAEEVTVRIEALRQRQFNPFEKIERSPSLEPERKICIPAGPLIV
jgi:D-alanyl-D-alanine carboxypeptidase